MFKKRKLELKLFFALIGVGTLFGLSFVNFDNSSFGSVYDLFFFVSTLSIINLYL